VFTEVDFDAHEAVNFICDRRSGLRAIVAVHSTYRGPAIGGCRVWHYASDGEALHDALRLSRGMTYKAAMADVPFGGGKAVVLADTSRTKTPLMMQALGEAIQKMGGRYITGEDVGTNCEDMEQMRRATSYVMGLPASQGGSGDPSGNTALGCFEGIRASLGIALQRDDCRGVHVAVQGLGNVGSRLCRLLAAAGARLTVADVDQRRADSCVRELGAKTIDSNRIYDVEAEVFAPCALGAVLNADTVSRLRVRIVAGGANNQLARADCGAQLRDRGILYAPDYVINAGGMIQLAAERTGEPLPIVDKRVRAVHDTLTGVYRYAQDWGIPTNEAADELALQRLGDPC
jgi:leucine dehydrogenase